MSAWIVSKTHIDLIVATVKGGTRDGIIPPGPQRGHDAFGQALETECVRSVSYRYPDDDVEKGELPGPCDPYYLQPYTFTDPHHRLTVAELCKAIDCYCYQSCEHPEWKESPVALFFESYLKDIQSRSREARTHYDRRYDYHTRPTWKAYEDAPWGFDERHLPATPTAVVQA